MSEIGQIQSPLTKLLQIFESNLFPYITVCTVFLKFNNCTVADKHQKLQ